MIANYLRKGCLGLWLVLGVLLPGRVAATHIRAGDIQAIRQPGGLLLYNFVLTVYTDTQSSVDDVEATLYFGDGNSATVRRDPPVILSDNRTRQSVYRFSHTYSSPGVFRPYYIGNNRNVTIRNISNPDDNSFYIDLLLIIDPFLGINNSPSLNFPPIDRGAIGRPFTHNPAAFDPDGDSLSYELIPSRQFLFGQGDVICTNFQFPDVRAGGRDSTNTRPAYMRIDPRTGDMVWDLPNLSGDFIVAMRIYEWRLDTLTQRRSIIGYVVRDMQITIIDSRNRPPKLFLPNDTCVLAGSRLEKVIRAIDRDSLNRVTITSSSGIYSLANPTHRAVFSSAPNQVSPAIGIFFWQPTCFQVREEPYDVVFKAEDSGPVFPRLADVQSWQIKVIAPAPSGLVVRGSENKFRLSWNNYARTVCPNADRIQIWRRVDSVAYQPDSCTTGMPSALGYEMITTVRASDSTYEDSSEIRLGRIYSYRLVATFPFPSLGESRVSKGDTALLPLFSPLMARVSIRRTDAVNGSVLVRWTQPLERANRPTIPEFFWNYSLKRAQTATGPWTTLAGNISSTDTTYIDSLLDTQNKTWYYQVVMHLRDLNQVRDMGRDSTQATSSVRLEATPESQAIRLNWAWDTPWDNGRGRQHYIYRQINGAFTLIDSVAVTGASATYTDRGAVAGPLVQRQRYYYRVVTQGAYDHPRFRQLLFNQSQEISSFIKDSIPPCPPSNPVVVQSPSCTDCESLKGTPPVNIITWEQEPGGCDSTVTEYRIYYTERENGSFQLVGRVPASAQRSFAHSNNGSLAGCYYLTYVDLFGNESAPSQRFCKDNCVAFQLPNIFTPNGDGRNEFFEPSCFVPGFVEEVSLEVYNRWGERVFRYEKSDRPFRWDGRIDQTGEMASTGTYFYYATVRFRRLAEGSSTTSFKGWVDLLK